MKDQLIICRCEEVTLQEIREAVAGGAMTARQVKMSTRAGMGFCQGRTCRHLIEQVAGVAPEQADPAVAEASVMAFKPPARPVTFGRLAGEGRK
ncbi:MAG: (2Fe-2S)-binding protein [Bacillota bacterium]